MNKTGFLGALILLVAFSGCTEGNSDPVVLTAEEAKSLGIFGEVEIVQQKILDEPPCIKFSYSKTNAVESDQNFVLLSCLGADVADATEAFETFSSDDAEFSSSGICKKSETTAGDQSLIITCDIIGVDSATIRDKQNVFRIYFEPNVDNADEKIKKTYELLHAKTTQFDVFNSFRWVLRIIRAAT
ncbi:MAG: hypothetical protein Q7K34_03350 [archaeon]|nr:hypothetical protein [archaeon]